MIQNGMRMQDNCVGTKGTAQSDGSRVPVIVVGEDRVAGVMMGRYLASAGD
jgi:hypothetical protein